jgi:hypothetical protein
MTKQAVTSEGDIHENTDHNARGGRDGRGRDERGRVLEFIVQWERRRLAI